jgi:hypothetical protein
MDTIKTIAVAAIVGVIVLVGVSLIGGKSNNLGSVPGVNLIPSQGLENNISLTPTDVSQTYTLEHWESGSTIYASATGTTTTLPVARAGLVYRFVVGGALDTANWVIDSAEGDNIEGSLIVAGAVVDCDAEDQLNFVADGENLGDYVELRSNGSKWFITQSNVLTTAKLTCTDPT